MLLFASGACTAQVYQKLGMGDSGVNALAVQIPARRLGTPSEVADVVVYFASDESGFTVVSELVIDGGRAIFEFKDDDGFSRAVPTDGLLD